MIPIEQRYDLKLLSDKTNRFILKTTNSENIYKHLDEAVEKNKTIGIIGQSGYGVWTAFSQYYSVARRRHYLIRCINRQRLKPILVDLLNKNLPQAPLINFTAATNKDLISALHYYFKNDISGKKHVLMLHNLHHFTPGEYVDLSYFFNQMAGLIPIVFSIHEDKLEDLKQNSHVGPSSFTNLPIKYYLLGPPLPSELYEFCYKRGIRFENDIKRLLNGAIDFHNVILNIESLKTDLEKKHGVTFP